MCREFGFVFDLQVHDLKHLVRKIFLFAFWFLMENWYLSSLLNEIILPPVGLNAEFTVMKSFCIWDSKAALATAGTVVK